MLVKQDATPEGISAEVQISNVDSSDSGPYFCQARNLYGHDQQLVQLQVQEPPQAPAAVEAAIVSSRSVNLKWQPRSGDSAEVTKYIVEYREFDRKTLFKHFKTKNLIHPIFFKLHHLQHHGKVLK